MADQLTPVPIDLETLGLDVESCVIIEFAMLSVTRELDIVADFGSRVIHATEEQLSVMNDFVRNMHTETGLLDEVRASTLTIDDVDREAVAWLAEQGIDTPRSGILLGSSCRLDLNFIDKYMPLLAGVLHYRMIDVSSIREAMLMWQPELVPPAPLHVQSADGFTAHRAASDIRWSLEEARDLRASIKGAYGLDAAIDGALEQD